MIRLLFRSWFSSQLPVVQRQKQSDSVSLLFVFQEVCEVNLTRLVFCLQMRGRSTKPPSDSLQFVHANRKEKLNC